MASTSEAPRYCPRCGVGAVAGAGPDGRLGCAVDGCGWVHWVDPKLAVVVLVEDVAGRLLYVRRGHEPAMGSWAWPSGFVDAGERVEDAAVREVREETGIVAQLGELLGVWSGGGDPVVLLVWRARAVGGVLQAGDEADDAAWFAVDAAPPSAFAHDASILRAWRRAMEKSDSGRGGS